ncbi:Lrp/AsnC family transcriptional regulator [uncultured Ralstonia sp.]|jgi:Lrp/AsnC family leucine-responsive transcriptional regulator|uniref:Lrp/AsnC family transcriptional regulator n=2 Tax=Ralstonia TaxID=48736 RepID=UPI001EAC4564|nr:Lrp/AsnC family transcriptional regulator [uncultured Ralstonia sp.]UCF21785.1 MAG: Lrp/AsnC family transcriptional regulator [Ralstonia sp.]
MNDSVVLDRVDCALLDALQENARLTVAELGERVSLTSSPCWRRIKRLEELGLVQGYRAILSAEKLGYGVTAFVNVMMGDHAQDVLWQFEKRMAEIPEVVSCHHVSGRYDYLLEVVAIDLKSFGEFARNVLQAVPGVKELYSSFSLKAVKDDRVLPLSSAHAR